MSKEIEYSKAEFLYAAITDTQGTIRATDSKIAVLMVILAIPLTRLGSVYRDWSHLYANEHRCISNLALILGIMFVSVWILSFWATMRALNPVDDPSQHIDGEKPNGTFYSGALFNPGFWAAHFKCFTRSKKQLQHQLDELPSSLRLKTCQKNIRVHAMRRISQFRDTRFSTDLSLEGIA